MKEKLIVSLFLFVMLFINLPMLAQESDIENQIDPYYSRYLSKYVDENQVDFSQDYLKYCIENNSKNQLSEFLSYDFSAMWTALNSMLYGAPLQNGIIGNNYQRIQIHISEVSRSKKNEAIYFVKGKSKVNNTICNFSGEIELLRLTCNSDCNYSDFSECGSLVAKYTLYEDSLQRHSGFFKGITDCLIYFDTAKQMVGLDDTLSGADFYYNRTFVGTWTNYITKTSKKCIWGDDRLPYTFDFSHGDGQMVINEKYVKNGWESFNDYSEYKETSDGEWKLADKWWLKDNEHYVNK